MQVTRLAGMLSAAKAALQAVALLCFATAAAGVLLPTGAPAELTEVMAGGGSLGVGGWTPGSFLFMALALLVGGGGPEGVALRGALVLAASLLVSALQAKAEECAARFVSGVYPPPRNLAKD